jgi:phospholipid/cholesterol/gamma-HCH transport system permease protein
VAVLGIVREASPIVTALLIAGAGGSAICADLGSRKIRDEIDAMEVLGVSPLQRLVVPRVLAVHAGGVLPQRPGVGGRRDGRLLLQRHPAGRHPGRLPGLLHRARPAARPLRGQIKALIFGSSPALVASYKALNAKGGPKGVGDAVNQSVVITFMLLFLTNFIITAIYFQVVPQKGG